MVDNLCDWVAYPRIEGSQILKGNDDRIEEGQHMKARWF